MSLQPKPRLSCDDWLAGERASLDARGEYIDGAVYAMSGGTFEHNAIISNIVGHLLLQMKGRPCRVFGSVLKLRVRTTDAGKYSDLMSFCGEPEFHDGRPDVLLNPEPDRRGAVQHHSGL